MRKIASLLLAMLLLITSITPVMANNNITVKIDGKQIAFDVQPQLINSRTMVPLRAIFEALGATVDWNDDTQTVTSTKSGTTISLTINNPTMYVNGAAITLDSPACLVGGRTLVPVRAISEAFGTKVDWDGNNNTVLISTNANSNIVYDANGIKITYKDYEVNLYDWIALKINFLIENNSSDNIIVQTRDTSINGFMIDGVMSDEVAAGKKMNADLTFHGSDLEENGISSIDDIEFCFYFWYRGNSNKDDVKTKPIKITQNGVTSQNIAPKVAQTTTVTPTVPATNQNVEVSYNDFVDFVKTKGSIGKDGTYGIQSDIPYHSSSSGQSYGTITLVYDPDNKELQLQVLEYMKHNDGDVTMLFTTIDLPKKSTKYDWQFQYMIDDSSYKNNDYFMAAEGTLKANVDSYFDDDSIKTTNIITGKEITTGSAANNVAALMVFVPIYGNKIFSENGSSLSFDYFGIK